MTASRPFVPRIVVLAPAAALGDLAGWARCWTEAGADALGLAGNPGDPVVAGLIAAVRTASPLPLEVVAPPAAEPRPEWAEPLAKAEVDWLLPGRPAAPATAEALAAAGVAWAWPMAAGPAPADSRRLHARGPAEARAWDHGPSGAERSLAGGAEGGPGPGAEAADTLVLPGERLTPSPDPAAELAGWRP